MVDSTLLLIKVNIYYLLKERQCFKKEVKSQTLFQSNCKRREYI